ncbi:MAG: hypothetical protein HYS38_10110 [Acidobacteria bacterium]|nr:hypothetical protein [Acidobacteriota bacterium]
MESKRRNGWAKRMWAATGIPSRRAGRWGRERVFFLALAVGLVGLQDLGGAELQQHTVAAWGTYVRLTERRITAELDGGQKFLVTDFLGDSEASSVRNLLRRGQVDIRKMKTLDAADQEIQVKDGMIHHWLGSIFVPGVKLDSFLEWLQDYNHHAQRFQEVEESRLLARNGNTFQIFLRLRRKKIITVYYNTEHSAVYRSHGPRRASSRGFATKIAELDHPGTPQEQEKPVGSDRGFLWRLNSYWRYQEEDGGVSVECESLSLSRDIPFGLGWLINGYVESVPRESLENTLLSIREGVKKTRAAEQASLPNQ